jgi:anaerobic selenocysteine-containing dehydrogenase
VPLAARGLARAIGSGAALDLLLRVGPHRMTLKDLASRPHGVDLGPLQPRLGEIVATRGRRIHLFPAPLAADLARLERTLSGPPDASLSLVSRRTLRSMNSWLHNSERMVKGPARCTLQMHRDDARARGLEHGSQVEVASRVGRIRALLEVSDEMMPGVVSMPYGWGHDRPGTRLSVASRRPGASMNDLADERRYDHVSGTSVVDGIPVTVEKAGAAAE